MRHSPILDDDSDSSGSGAVGSYLMYLSTYLSASSLDPAITAGDDIIADIVYAGSGWIDIFDDVDFRQVTGHGVRLRDDVTLEYNLGLVNAAFTSGPSAGWGVTSWKEIE